MIRDRFAPSPNGLLHPGHAYSALTAWDSVRNSSGEFVLRIEDIDTTRSRPEFEAAIIEDLAWLGIKWTGSVLRQSERMHHYESAVAKLASLGLCYPCDCTRADIRNALAAPQEAEGTYSERSSGNSLYPGTCRHRSMNSMTAADSVRLNMSKTIDLLGGGNSVSDLAFEDRGEVHSGRHRVTAETLASFHGDVVVARRDIKTSYHIAVVVDDALQDITQITRGADLFGATCLHRVIQELLNLPVPVWNHHRLIRDAEGTRMAKRRNSPTIQSLRKAGSTPEDIRTLVGLPTVSK